MKVILLKDVEKLGKKDDVREVANGYARNFLIPNKLAVLATKDKLVELEKEKEMAAKKAEEELAVFQEKASQIDGLEMEIAAKISEDQKLFGAITPKQITEKLKEKGIDIKKEQIKLETPIKEIGEYEATVEFPHNLEAKIKIIVIEEAKP